MTEQASPPTTTQGPDSEDTWQRVHPLTPLVRSWASVVTALALLTLHSGDTVREFFARLLHASNGSAGSSAGPSFDTSRWPLLALGLFGALAALVTLHWISWRATSFRVTATSVEVRRGVVRTQHQNARLDRVQAIDLVQPLIPRLLGLAELSFDVAGARHSGLRIGFLTRARAETLRDDMLAEVRARRGTAPTGPSSGVQVVDDPGSSTQPQVDEPGTSSATPGVPPGAAAEASHQSAHRTRPRTAGARIVETLSRESTAIGSDLVSTLTSTFAAYDTTARAGTGQELRPGQPIVHVPPHRVVLASMFRLSSLVALAWALFGVGTLIVGIVTGNAGAGWAIAFTSLVTAGGFLHTNIQAALKQANFSTTLTPDGLMITQGIATTEHRFVPLDRIQAVGVVQPLLWRPFGWWRVHYNIATGGLLEAVGEEHALLPVGTLDDALTMLGLALPLLPTGEPDDELTGARFRDAMSARPAGLQRQPRVSRWVDPLGWRVAGWHQTPSLTLIRQGRVERRVECIPHARVQSVGLRVGPCQRALGLATVSLHSTSGPVGGRIRHQSAAAARDMFFELADITRDARRTEQSMHRI